MRRETLRGNKAEGKISRRGSGAPLCGRKEAVQLVVASPPRRQRTLHKYFYHLSATSIHFGSGTSILVAWNSFPPNGVKTMYMNGITLTFKSCRCVEDI